MDALELEIKEILIDALKLEEVSPVDIDTEAPLFGGGLGLDSLDALELAMALGKRYGVKTGTDESRNRQIFASVRSLAQFVAEHRASVGERAEDSVGGAA